MSTTEGLEHEESLGPDDPGSMAFKLARAAEAPKAVAESEAAPVVEEPQPEEGEALQDAAAPEKTEEPPEPPKPKFETVEEYEKAYKEAETKMHTATEEAAKERKAREDLAAEIDLTKKELAEVKAAQEAAAAEAAKLVPQKERQEAYEKALAIIEAIPLTRGEDGEVVYPPDYSKQVAAAWATTSLDPEEIKRQVKEDLKKDFQQERQAEDTRTAGEKAEAERVQVRKDAEKQAAEQGLDMTPGSVDYDLFYARVDELARDPQHELRGKPFDEQVKWATGRVRQALGKKIEMTDAERAAAKRNQDKNAVLGRGVTRVAPPEPPKQRSMDQILQTLPR